MAENNNDKFWESNDDFWSKPVASDDWLKSDKNSWLNESEIQNNNDTKDIVKETVRDFGVTDEKKDKSPFWNEPENPYLNRDTDYYAYEAQQAKKSVNATVLNGKVLEKTKKKVHVHTIICLTFITIAILSVVGAFVRYSMAKKSAIKTVNQVNYQETEVYNAFSFDEYNEVELAEEAVSYVSEENFTGFPKDMKMIGIYLKVESAKYISGANVLHDIYIGYETDGRQYYQEIPRQDVIYPYASSRGFTREEILGSYGLGNGIDDEGYLFFFVPKELSKVTLYMPKTVKDNNIDVIETVYYVSFPIVEDGKEAEK